MNAPGPIPVEAAHLGELRSVYPHGSSGALGIAACVLGGLIGIAFVVFGSAQVGVPRYSLWTMAFGVVALAVGFWFLNHRARDDRTLLFSGGVAAVRFTKVHTLRWEDIGKVLYLAPSYHGDGPAAFMAAYRITRKDGSEFPVLSTDGGYFSLDRLKELGNVLQDEIEKLPARPVWEKKYLG